MTKTILFLLPLLAFSSPIKVEHAQEKPLGKIIQANAQITQLSDQQQTIVSRLSGHLEAYYVKPGQHVSKGDKVVLIESIELSKMTAEYLALNKQLEAAKKQKRTAITLHKKGLASQNDASNAIIALENIRSQKDTLASQLSSLGVDPTTLKKTTDQFILYAHADGTVGTILAPLHTNVTAQTELVTLVKQSGYYATAFISANHAMHVSKETQGWIKIGHKSYHASFVQLMPNIDQETQRAKVLFKINESPKNLLLGAFTQMDISLEARKNVVMVKKSALTLYKGEWVVFVEKEHKEAAHHEEKSDHDHDNEKAAHDEHDHKAEKKEEAHGHDDHGHDTHKEEKGHEEHADKDHDEKEEGHGEHEEEESPYDAKVVEIIAYVGDEIAVKGLNAGEEYVSDGVYFVKSMLLKSSLGEHGH
ncbi:MAG TPA: efflux RND transporter periplasmic adaptor subunit [Sulfurovum sp.]|nr:efflux RND transporter periplasmic adaptor subunit [Sulfurovum sp.]